MRRRVFGGAVFVCLFSFLTAIPTGRCVTTAGALQLGAEQEADNPAASGKSSNSQLKTEPGAAKSQRIPELIERLKHPDVKVRIVAAKELAKMGPAARDAVPALVAALREQAPETQSFRVEVSNALEKIGAAAVPALIEALKDLDAYIRRCAALILGEIGPSAKDAVPALVAALKDKSPWVRAYAARALGGGFFTVEPWEPNLGEMFFHFGFCGLYEGEGQLAACTRAEARGGIGLGAKAAIPALIEALEDNNELVIWHSAQAIGVFGLDAKTAIPTLRNLLVPPRPNQRMHAASALVQVGEASAGLATLISMLNYVAPNIRQGSMTVSGNSWPVRLQAVQMLGDLGPTAKDAVPALTEALKSADEGMRKVASEALKKIQAK